MKSFPSLLFPKRKHKKEAGIGQQVYEVLFCVDPQVMLFHSYCIYKSSYGAAYGNFYFLIYSCYSGNHVFPLLLVYQNLRTVITSPLSNLGDKEMVLNYYYIYYYFISPKPETHLTITRPLMKLSVVHFPHFFLSNPQNSLYMHLLELRSAVESPDFLKLVLTNVGAKLIKPYHIILCP